MLVVDLFSGTGAATKAFKDRGHKVITVDIDPKLKPEIVADIRHFPIRNLKPDFVWASPPCQDFSNINHRNWKRLEKGGWPEAGFETYCAALDAIAELRPTYYAIENVRGAAKFPQFDTSTLRKGFYALYGEDSRRLPGAKPVPAKQAGAIPCALSLALCCAIERDLL